jgi:hypothetical protein
MKLARSAKNQQTNPITEHDTKNRSDNLAYKEGISCGKADEERERETMAPGFFHQHSSIRSLHCSGKAPVDKQEEKKNLKSQEEGRV